MLVVSGEEELVNDKILGFELWRFIEILSFSYDLPRFCSVLLELEEALGISALGTSLLYTASHLGFLVCLVGVAKVLSIAAATEKLHSRIQNDMLGPGSTGAMSQTSWSCCLVLVSYVVRRFL